MHAAVDIRVLKCFEALTYSFEMLDECLCNLHDVCSSIRADMFNFIRAMNKCWMSIDLIHRIRELTQAVPGLNTQQGEARLFLDRTKSVEGFRHYTQHLRNELKKVPLDPFPVWGTLAWVDSADPCLSFVAISGLCQNGITHYPSCIYDIVEQKWVSRVSLTLGKSTIQFDQMNEACAKFREYFQNWIAKSIKTQFKLKGLQIVKVSAVQSPQARVVIGVH